MNPFLKGTCWLAVPIAAYACSAGTGGGGGRPSAGGGQTGGVPGSGGSGVVLVGGGLGVGGGFNLDGGPSGGSGGIPACATESAQATLTTDPVDIILVLDNSGSMEEEMVAAEANINNNFATILQNAGVDYRVILLSRHRGLDGQNAEAASTSICVSQPLSGLATCPGLLPVFTDRFFQYSEKIESFDALNRLINLWNAVPESDNLEALHPNGYSPWLRPGAKKAIVLMTDDDESNDDVEAPLTVQTFLQQFTALAPDQFGTADAPTFRFHSIIGIAEKADPTAPYTPDEPPNPTECTGNGADIESYGPTYQDLSILTGGLRFPLCQFPGYDAVFSAIANDVVTQAVLTCDFAIPEPPAGRTLELEKVAVVHTLADGTTQQLQQAPTSADCAEGLFYIENNRVWLCEQACTAIKEENGANVEVLFTCENQVVVPV